MAGDYLTEWEGVSIILNHSPPYGQLYIYRPSNDSGISLIKRFQLLEKVK